jgi:hypothetical protein
MSSYLGGGNHDRYRSTAGRNPAQAGSGGPHPQSGAAQPAEPTLQDTPQVRKVCHNRQTEALTIIGPGKKSSVRGLATNHNTCKLLFKKIKTFI